MMTSTNIKSHPRIFISYSHADKEFAKKLDATMIANNIDTFLDEREIQVGDSILNKIYDGIASSTHLVYIISEKSIDSKWVKEEFSVAKMKEMQSDGFTILPILIESIELPIQIAHLKYADFTKWRNPDAYHEAFLEILRALNIQPTLLGREELVWYAGNRHTIVDAHSSLAQIINRLLGGFQATQFLGPNDLIEPMYVLRKRIFYDWGVIADLYSLHNLLEHIREDDNTRLGALKRSIQKNLEFGNNISENKHPGMSKLDEFRMMLRETVYMLDDIKNELELNLFASVDRRYWRS